MKNHTRRVLAFITSLVILLSLSPLQVIAETFTFELFSLAEEMPPFVADSGTYSPLVDTSSTNSHTYPRHIWVQDGYVYFAGWVQHTKEFGYFRIEGLQPAPGDLVYMDVQNGPLTIGDTSVSGILAGSSNIWWVARFPVSMISLDGSYSYSMIVGAPGHDIPIGEVIGSLTINKTANRETYHLGDVIVYTIIVKNNSNVSITIKEPLINSRFSAISW